MIVYTGNLKHSTIKKLINEKQVSTYKINIQKSHMPQQTIRKWKFLDGNIYNMTQKPNT